MLNYCSFGLHKAARPYYMQFNLFSQRQGKFWEADQFTTDEFPSQVSYQDVFLSSCSAFELPEHFKAKESKFKFTLNSGEQMTAM